MAKAPKLSVAEARAFITSRGIELKKPVYTSETYLPGLARSIQRQEAAGLPLSRQAARRHTVTPEHPTSRRPLLPASPLSYPGDPRKSKYRRHTQPLGEREPRLRPAVVVQSPPVHTRLGRPAAGMVLDAPRQKILITRSPAKLGSFLRQLERSDPRWRVGFDVFDCTTGRQASVFRTVRGRRGAASEGMTVGHLLDEASELGYTLEEFLIVMEQQFDSGSPAGVSRLAHICEYVIYAHLP